ncbi:hypothetical protein AVEN_86205-1, partial [Araneus ventricosus]
DASLSIPLPIKEIFNGKKLKDKCCRLYSCVLSSSCFMVLATSSNHGKSTQFPCE